MRTEQSPTPTMASLSLDLSRSYRAAVYMFALFVCALMLHFLFPFLELSKANKNFP